MALPFRLSLAAALLVPTVATAQSADAVVRLEAVPASLELTAGESVSLAIRAYDAQGQPVDVPIRFAAPRRALRVRGGKLEALAAGSWEVVATLAVRGRSRRPPPRVRIPVKVNWPPVATLDVTLPPGRLYAGTEWRLTALPRHADGTLRPDPSIRWSTSDASVATIDPYGHLRAHLPGPVTIIASVEGVDTRQDLTVFPFTAGSLVITGGDSTVRTGDVQQFTAVVRDADGRPLPDVPVVWSHRYEPAPGILAPAAPGQMVDGRMVADVPGVYTAIAAAGPLRAEWSFRVEPRDVIQRVQVVGHGRQNTHYTSDLWVFEGRDGRDYALTGARQAQSHAFVWDITDPANIVKTDSIQVDARSLNDIKVSPDARYAVLTREGASNRRNGIVLLDLINPGHPTVASTFDQELTGGVHNVFATDTHVFAVSGGDKYVIVDVRDIYHPRYVSEYNHPDSRIHDVWVHDGIAYSAEWQTGVVVVDVGNGRWGGTIEHPVFVTAFPLPSGATHAVFPYYQESTGNFYLFVGDEIVNRRGLAWEGTGPDHRQQYDPKTGRGGYPRATSGYIQIVNFTDPEHPEMVARYEVSEYGTHNIWVEDDKLYQAYYEGGLRVVDVSGALMGNLYTQGREIAVFKAFDPLGWIPNSPAAWSAIPWKGNIFFSDINSGIWSVRLEPKDRPVM